MRIGQVENEIEGRKVTTSRNVEKALTNGMRQRSPGTSPKRNHNSKSTIFEADYATGDLAAIAMQTLGPKESVCDFCKVDRLRCPVHGCKRDGALAQGGAPMFEPDYQPEIVSHSVDYATPAKQKGETRSFDQLLPNDWA
jgi:hypothetical protein